jgi:hypothetical protein
MDPRRKLSLDEEDFDIDLSSLGSIVYKRNSTEPHAKTEKEVIE